MSVLRMCVDMYAFVYVSKELGNLTDELFFFQLICSSHKEML